MPEEIKEENNEVEQNKIKVIEELNQRLSNAVSKEEYDKLVKENKELLENYVNKRPAPNKQADLLPAKDYAKKLKSMSTMTNRQFIETSVNYRDAMLRELGRDPWSDNGEPTSETAKVAETFKSLLQDTPDDFTFRTKLHNVMRDDAGLIARLRSNKRK